MEKKNGKGDTLSDLPQEKQQRIREIKEQWWAEISEKFDQWAKDSHPGMLDEHLREQCQIEQKYTKKIEEILQKG